MDTKEVLNSMETIRLAKGVKVKGLGERNGNRKEKIGGHGGQHMKKTEEEELEGRRWLHPDVKDSREILKVQCTNKVHARHPPTVVQL